MSEKPLPSKEGKKDPKKGEKVKASPAGDAKQVLPERPAPEAPKQGLEQPVPMPPLEHPPIEQVLVDFADQVGEHLRSLEAQITMLVQNVGVLILRVNAIEQSPHGGDTAAAMQALGEILKLVLPTSPHPTLNAGTVGNGLPDLTNLVNALKQAARPSSLTPGLIPGIRAETTTAGSPAPTAPSKEGKTA